MGVRNGQPATWRARPSPKRRIFLSAMQNYLGASHRGGGCCADRNRRVDAADCCRRSDCLRLSGLHPGHRPAHDPWRTLRQHHLLRVRGGRRIRLVRVAARSADVLRIAPQISATVVPLTTDGGHQRREHRLPHVYELRRAGARWTIPSLHSAGGQNLLDPRRHLSYCVTKALRGMVSGRSTELTRPGSAATT
jgi:hypothetical protein